MTYSPTHVTPAQRVEDLAAALTRDLAEIPRLFELCDAVSDMRGRRPPADPDGTGRRASAGPGRPTEDTALDEARQLVTDEQRAAVQHMVKAAAYVKGVRAALDRALSAWEGEPVESHDEGAASADGHDAGDPDEPPGLSDGTDDDPGAAG
ncbi:DUF7169 domain-containing protein [Kitasatospora sp. Ki12]